MSSSGQVQALLDSGATGNLAGAGTPTGFSMPDGSGNTLFSMPNGQPGVGGATQMNPLSMGQGVMNGVTPVGGANMSSLGSLLGAAKGMSQQTGWQPQNGAHMPYHGGEAVNFMPPSAVTLPYSLASGGTSGLLQQILRGAQGNPI